MKNAFFIVLFLSLSLLIQVDGKEKNSSDVRNAVEAGLRIVQRGAQNYPNNRDCFSCHHQTLPMLAMHEASKAGITIDSELMKDQVQFIRDLFEDRLDSVTNGKSLGGRSLTAGHVLWSFELGGASNDDYSDAFVSYILHQQRKEGYWDVQTNRPPSEESKIHTSYFAIYYMNYFARGKDIKNRVKDAVDKARPWLMDEKPNSQEDFNGKLKALIALKASPEKINNLRKDIIKKQREDGGWAQLSEMESDAYATGQTLYTLLKETPKPDRDITFNESVIKARSYLLKNQKDDGSWLVKTRSKPIQKFFDNGDPHGKNQFISISATSWATAALAKFHSIKDL